MIPHIPVKYDINMETGEVRRLQGEDNLHVANIVDSQIVYLNDELKAKYEAVVTRRVNEARREAKREAKAAAAQPLVVEQPVPLAVAQTETVSVAPIIVTSVPAPTMNALTIEQRKAVNYLRRQEGFPDEVETPIPMAPKKGAYGDKNPDFVTHLLRYQPEEFVRRYGVTGMGEVQATRSVFDSTTSRKKIEKYMQSGVISRRKTIYTLIDPAKLGVKDE